MSETEKETFLSDHNNVTVSKCETIQTMKINKKSAAVDEKKSCRSNIVVVTWYCNAKKKTI